MTELTHFDEDGASRMVDVSQKEVTLRQARAEAVVRMKPETLVKIRDRGLSKGDVLEVARLAGIMAVKRTGDLIPLCHPLSVDRVEVNFEFVAEDAVRAESVVSVHARTGVEMEALVAASTAALTIYDMCKAIDRGMAVERLRLLEKSGGKSGHYQRTS